ncbi:MAG: electron transfer flavoprotein subunit alpha/FixB family protein, partial [Acidimicrobiia bacterium]
MASVWVFVEETNREPSSLGLELLSKGRELGEVTAIYLGGGGDEAFATLGAHGAIRVWHVDAGDRLPSGPV